MTKLTFHKNIFNEIVIFLCLVTENVFQRGEYELPHLRAEVIFLITIFNFTFLFSLLKENIFDQKEI